MPSTDMKTLRAADWEQLEKDVVQRIRLLAIAARNMESNDLNDKIANELILPSLLTLGKFCAAVDLADDDNP